MKQLTRQIGDYWTMCHASIESKLIDWGYQTRDDKGAVSTETAIVVGFLAAAAAAGGAIIITKATSNAQNIPDSVNP